MSAQKEKRRKQGGSVLPAGFKAQRTAQLESAFESRLSALERREQELTEHPVTPPTPRAGRAIIALDAVRLDGGTQPRVSTSEELIAEYAERMVWDEARGEVVDPEGVSFEPVVVFEDGAGETWLADGFHRILAARARGFSTFQARRERGEVHDAFLYSLGVNATHGKRRSNADKRRAVERALHDERVRERSDRAIAELCKVSNRMVSLVRGELVREAKIPEVSERVGRDGASYEAMTKSSIDDNKVLVKAHARPTLEGGAGVTVVAFAKGGEELERLLEGHGVSGGARLLVPFPQQGGEVMRLDAVARGWLGEGVRGPWPIYLKDQDRIYLAWSEQELPVSCGKRELVGGGEVRVVGEAREPW